jgi:hypothetical protein
MSTRCLTLLLPIYLQVDQCYISAFDETVEEMKESSPTTCRGSPSDSEDSCSPPHAEFILADEPAVEPLQEDLQNLKITKDDSIDFITEQEMLLTKAKEDVFDDAFYFYQGEF